LAEARVVLGDRREDYSERRPHSAPAMKAPAVFAAGRTTESEALLAARRHN
jgi:hypothetical protein